MGMALQAARRRAGWRCHVTDVLQDLGVPLSPAAAQLLSPSGSLGATGMRWPLHGVFDVVIALFDESRRSPPRVLLPLPVVGWWAGQEELWR